MTVSELARRAELPQSSLSRYLAGQYPLDLNQVEALARALEVPVLDLLGPAAEGRSSVHPTRR
jgi:transcriptional regulator with XRE-family HTH domain